MSSLNCDVSYHAQPVWNDGMVAGVAVGLVPLHIASDGVGEPVAEVDTSVAKPDACEGGCQVHLAPGLRAINVWIGHGLKHLDHS